jgi:prepilin-type N-terminal cleavage/methylation domain-containing protein
MDGRRTLGKLCDGFRQHQLDERTRAAVLCHRQCNSMLNRRAFTLPELIVALVLAAIVLGTATTSMLRQQQVHARLMSVAQTDAQLRASTTVLANQLAWLNASAGDLTPGQAEDTALQFRAPIAASIACNDGVGSTTFLPDSDGLSFGGLASQPGAGDSLWWRRDSSWTGERITDATTVKVVCASPVSSSGSAVHVTIAPRDTIPAGTPLRVTRQTRYGIYRSSDGTWQLGFREWSDATQRFAAPQPVAGPLLLSDGTRRSGFRYFDSAGVELTAATGPTDVTRISRIRITAYSLVPVHDKSQDSVRTDSVDVATAAVHAH